MQTAFTTLSTSSDFWGIVVGIGWLAFGAGGIVYGVIHWFRHPEE